MALLAGQKSVASAGAPEALAASTASLSVVVQAKRSNTRSVLLGTSSVQFLELLPGESVGFDVQNLNQVYVKVSVNGEGVNYLGVA
jgi:hypothetical protein